MIKVVCITGKAGSGKSTVCDFLKKKGFRVINIDRLGHVILDENKELIEKRFGPGLIENGKLSRKKLSKRVFSAPELLNELEEIVHPLMRERIKKILNNIEGPVFIDVAIPVKLGIVELCDLVVLVDAPEEIIRKRLEKAGWSEEKIEEVLKRQKGEKIQPDYVIKNTGSIDSLHEEVIKFLKEVKLC